jgi:large subunit ribosomal protein L7/L12
LKPPTLVKQLETKWGVTAAAPVAAAAAGSRGGAAAPVAEAKTIFDVILVSVPAEKKIAAIKAVREVKAGLGLAEAKALVEGAPKPVLEGANKADSDAAKKKLEEAGAKGRSQVIVVSLGRCQAGHRPAFPSSPLQFQIKKSSIIRGLGCLRGCASWRDSGETPRSRLVSFGVNNRSGLEGRPSSKGHHASASH